MGQTLTVLAREDGPYYARIREAVEIANNLQTYFRFVLEEATWLPREKGRPKPLADKTFRKEIKRNDDREPLIIVTSIPLYGGNFAFEYRDQSVISAHDWEDNFAPPPVKIYLLYEFAYVATIVAAELTEARTEKMQHHPNGCLFDESIGEHEFRVSLVGAQICADCGSELAGMMIPGEAVEAISDILGYVRSATIRKVMPIATSIFVGHGGAKDWEELAAFLRDELNCKVVEFNSEPTAGLFSGARLMDMLAQSRFAFLVMTAEDERADGSFQARQNVIHEIGLFQGRLGFNRAVMLKEDKADAFSNVAGLTYIGFRRGELAKAFSEVTRTLMRGRLVDNVAAEKVLRKLKS